MESFLELIHSRQKQIVLYFWIHLEFAIKSKKNQEFQTRHEWNIHLFHSMQKVKEKTNSPFKDINKSKNEIRYIWVIYMTILAFFYNMY